MNRYQSHKIVEAGQITSMEENEGDPPGFDVGIEGDAEPYMITLDEGKRIMRMAADVDLKLMEGHLMLYKDGYVSWAPNHTMEDYDLVQPSSGKSKIAGYRELTEAEISDMNYVKNIGVELGDVVKLMRESSDHDQRWVSLGATHFQQGLMCLTRSIAKPDFF